MGKKRLGKRERALRRELFAVRDGIVRDNLSQPKPTSCKSVGVSHMVYHGKTSPRFRYPYGNLWKDLPR